MIYFLLIILLYGTYFILWKFFSLSLDDRKFLYVYISCSILFLISGFRGEALGLDTSNYMSKFELIDQNYSWGSVLTHFYTERVEIGYAVFNKFIGFFFDNPHSIIIASAALFSILLCVFVYKYVDDYLTAIILFVCTGVYLYSFNISRQMIACILLLIAWGLLNEKRYKSSIACFLLAVSFHWFSLIFFFVAYLLYFLKDQKKAVTAILVLGFILLLNFVNIIELFSSFTSSFSYLDNSDNKLSIGGIVLVWIIEVAFSVFYLLYYFTGTRFFLNKIQVAESTSVSETLCIPVFVLLYIAFTYLGTQFNYIDRFGTYFMPFTILLFLNIGKQIKYNSLDLYRIYIIGLHICFVLYFLFFCTDSYSPYIFIWDL